MINDHLKILMAMVFYQHVQLLSSIRWMVVVDECRAQIVL